MAAPIELDCFDTRAPVASRPPSPSHPSPAASLKGRLSAASLPELALSRAPSAAEPTGVPEFGAQHGVESAVLELEPVDGGRGAYIFLLNAFMLEFVLWGYAGAFGSVQLYLSSHVPFSSASLGALGAVGTICLALFYILPLLLISVFRRFPHHLRISLWIALAVNTAAMFASSFATNVGELIFLQGIVCGAAGAVLYVPAMIWVQEWFVVRRGWASGVIFSATGVAGVTFPLALSQLLDKVGFAWTARVWALFSLVVLAPVVYSVRPRLPVVRPGAGARFQPVDFSFLRTRATAPLVLLSVFSSLSYFPVSSYLTNFTTSVGSSLSADLCLSVMQGAWTVSALVVGWSSDKLGWAYLLAALGALECLVAFSSWTTADSLGSVFGFAVLFGLFAGHTNAWMAVARDVAGSNPANASVVCSFMFVLRGVSCVVGPLVASALYKPGDAGGGVGLGHFGFGGVMVWVGVMAGLSGVAGLYMAAVRPSSRRKHQ